MLLQQSIEHVSIVYTCNTYCITALVHVAGQCSHTIIKLPYQCKGLFQHHERAKQVAIQVED